MINTEIVYAILITFRKSNLISVFKEFREYPFENIWLITWSYKSFRYLI